MFDLFDTDEHYVAPTYAVSCYSFWLDFKYSLAYLANAQPMTQGFVDDPLINELTTLYHFLPIGNIFWRKLELRTKSVKC